HGSGTDQRLHVHGSGNEQRSVRAVRQASAGTSNGEGIVADRRLAAGGRQTNRRGPGSVDDRTIEGTTDTRRQVRGRHGEVHSAGKSTLGSDGHDDRCATRISA